MKNRHPGRTGKGTPGPQAEKAADRQRETTGGLNYPGTDVNREADGPHVEYEPDKESTQGVPASGDMEGGSTLSAGESHP